MEREGGRKKMENEGEKKRPTGKEAQRRWHGRAARHGHPVPNRWAFFFLKQNKTTTIKQISVTQNT